MWKKVKSEAEIESFVDMVNMFGCAQVTKRGVKHFQEKLDAELFMYEDDDFRVLFGFRYHKKKDRIFLLFVTNEMKNPDADPYQVLHIAAKHFKKYKKKKIISIRFAGEPINVKMANKADFLKLDDWYERIPEIFAQYGIKVTYTKIDDDFHTIMEFK